MLDQGCRQHQPTCGRWPGGHYYKWARLVLDSEVPLAHRMLGHSVLARGRYYPWLGPQGIGLGRKYASASRANRW